MAHDWEDVPAYLQPGQKVPSFRRVRKCKNCGKTQIYVCVVYDRMSGSTYRWRPLAGRCKKEQEMIADE